MKGVCRNREGFLIVLVLTVGWLGLQGCGGGDNLSPGDGDDDEQSDVPEVPLSTELGDVMPEFSDTLLVEEVQVRDFQPEVQSCLQATNDLTAWWQPLAPFPGVNRQIHGARIDPDRRQTLFVDETEIRTPPDLHYEIDCTINVLRFWIDCEDMWDLTNHDCRSHPAPQLQEIPIIQRHRFWRKIFTARITYPANYTESHSYTEGTSETLGRSFSIALGGSASRWGLSLSAKLTATFSHQVTVSEATTIQHTFSSSAIEGKVVHFTAWQLVEMFRLCNGDLSDYTDPEYEFVEIPVISNGTNELYLSAVPFDP